MDHDFREALAANAHIIAETYKRKERTVSEVIGTLSGTRQEMLMQFFSRLNLPLNAESMVVLNSIVKSGSEEGFFSRIRRFFGEE
jgi:hypothetical protein